MSAFSTRSLQSERCHLPPAAVKAPCPSCHLPPSNQAAVEDWKLAAEGRAHGDDEVGFLNYAFESGLYTQGEGRRAGTRGEVSGMKTDLPLGDRCRLQTKVAEAGFEGSVGADGATFGAGVTGGGAAIDCTKGSKQDVDIALARGGLNGGGGAALRLHWSDTDGDGLREFGAGGDIGPFTADYKTELPHHLVRTVSGGAQ